MSEIIPILRAEWALISNAPFVLLAICVAVATLVWIAIHWAYKTRLSGKDGELALLQRQRDDYKEKLGGASPDQAKARIDALEARLAAIEPRRLSNEQRSKLTGAIAAAADGSHKIGIMFDKSSTDATSLSRDLVDLIRAVQGWTVEYSGVLGSARDSATGIVFLVPDVGGPSSDAKFLMRAFEVAGLRFEVRERAGNPPRSAILVTGTSGATR